MLFLGAGRAVGTDLGLRHIVVAPFKGTSFPNLPLPHPSTSYPPLRLLAIYLAGWLAIRDVWDMQDIGDVREMRDMRDMQDIRDVQDMQDMQDMQEM